MSIGSSGLFAAKKKIETAGHNIANANNENYSRQRVDVQAAPPIGSGNVVHGSGVYIKGVNRVHDRYVQAKINDMSAETSFHEEEEDYEYCR